MNTLHLFPDTNLFVQCFPIAEIDWSPWAEIDEVRLIICRPVQRELDRQKGRGSDRLGKRARKVHSTLRRMIVNGQDNTTIQDTTPRVKLVLAPSCMPDPELSTILDYNHFDDCLVGCVYAYRQTHPGFDIRLLTHDSGPMATARMLSLPFLPIPDQWLLPPERSDAERQIGRLQDALAKHQNTEPQFHITGIDTDRDESDSFQFERRTYARLSDLEVSACMDSLTTEFRPATYFGPRERPQPQSLHEISHLLSSMHRFIPASEEDIVNYRETAYPRWVEECEKTLRQLSVSLDIAIGPIELLISVRNNGSRPGKDVLVTIYAHGNFMIRPLQPEGYGNGPKEVSSGLSLPFPPNPPKERWETDLDMLSRVGGGLDVLNRGHPLDPLLADPIDHRRDPNAFYYKPCRPETPVESYCVECEQWRHGIQAEIFQSELCIINSDREIRGAIECQIHAENLSIPARKVIPVRGTITRVSVRSIAESMIARLRDRKEEQDIT